jgi:hypothetical protein
MLEYITVEFSNGTMFKVPVDVIVQHKTKYFTERYGRDFECYFKEDFESEPNMACEWAADHMTWDEIKKNASLVRVPEEPDFSKEFPNASFGIMVSHVA